VAGQVQNGLGEEIIEALKGLPGQKGIMFWAPTMLTRATPGSSVATIPTIPGPVFRATWDELSSCCAE
jgi:hypothetical protein